MMFRAILAAACFGLILAGCNPPPAATNEPSTPTPGAAGSPGGPPKMERSFTIGYSQCNPAEPWRVQMDADVKAAAAEHPNITLISKSADNDSLKQRGHVEEFVEAKVDLIIISPKEAQPLTEPIAKAYDAGIPVIVLDRAVNGDKYTCFIGADNVKIGKAAGEWLKTKLGGKGTVVELKGLQTSVPGVDRHNGFRDGIKGSDIKVAFEADMKWLEGDARKEMESALSRLPHIDAVYAHNDPGAHGAYLAAKNAGREKEMIFVGIDALPSEGVEYVKNGLLSATFQYPTGGKEAIETALKILAGETVEKKIVLGSRLFTTENAASGGEELN
jgi:ribose transport system substrate-binding protein